MISTIDNFSFWHISPQTFVSCIVLVSTMCLKAVINTAELSSIQIQRSIFNWILVNLNIKFYLQLKSLDFLCYNQAFLLIGKSRGQWDGESQGKGKWMWAKSTYAFSRVGDNIVFSQCELFGKNSVLITLLTIAFNLSRESKEKFQMYCPSIFDNTNHGKGFELNLQTMNTICLLRISDNNKEGRSWCMLEFSLRGKKSK